MGNKSVVEVDGSQELLKRLGGSGLPYPQDAVDSVCSTRSAGGGDAVLADCVAQEIESCLSKDALVLVNHQTILHQ